MNWAICVHCEHEWEPDSDEEPLCPECYPNGLEDVSRKSRVIALAIDREQLRDDLKTAAAYTLLFGILVGYMGAVFEIIGITDFLPILADKVVAVLILSVYAYWWRSTLYRIAKTVAALPKRVCDRYTVEENAGGSGTDGS